MQPKSSLTVENSHWTSVFTLELCASPFSLKTLGPWIPNEMQNLLLSERRTLDYCQCPKDENTTVLHSPSKTLLTLYLVQKWLEECNICSQHLTPVSVHSLPMWSSYVLICMWYLLWVWYHDFPILISFTIFKFSKTLNYRFSLSASHNHQNFKK